VLLNMELLSFPDEESKTEIESEIEVVVSFLDMTSLSLPYSIFDIRKQKTSFLRLGEARGLVCMYLGVCVLLLR
jgi:hypothetical protein